MVSIPMLCIAFSTSETCACAMPVCFASSRWLKIAFHICNQGAIDAAKNSTPPKTSGTARLNCQARRSPRNAAKVFRQWQGSCLGRLIPLLPHIVWLRPISLLQAFHRALPQVSHLTRLLQHPASEAWTSGRNATRLLTAPISWLERRAFNLGFAIASLKPVI